MNDNLLIKKQRKELFIFINNYIDNNNDKS